MLRHGSKLLALLSAGAAMALMQVPAARITFTLPEAYAFWMAIPADIDGDGNEEIAMTTMDPNKVQVLTPPTPAYILGVSNGVVSDRSTELFAGKAPTAYSGKPTAGDFDADGRTDLAICDKGRDIGSSLAPGSVFTPGVRGGPNTGMVQRDGKLVAQTFPEVVAGYWGCSAGDIDRSGRAALVINAFIRPAGYPNTYLVQWDGNKFIKTKDLTQPPANGQGYAWTSTADFDLDGYADVAGRDEVWWRVGTDQSKVRALAQSQIARAGYTFLRGSLAVDFTGDGYPDLVRIASGANEFSTGDARFMMYVSDHQGGLVEKTDAFPAVTTYAGNDFSTDSIAIDVDFNGTLDIVPFGRVANGFGGTSQPATAVWLNDGSGRFTMAHFSEPSLEKAFTSLSGTCRSSEAFFVKTAHSPDYNLVLHGCGGRFATRLVTPDNPLQLTP